MQQSDMEVLRMALRRYAHNSDVLDELTAGLHLRWVNRKAVRSLKRSMQKDSDLIGVLLDKVCS